MLPRVRQSRGEEGKGERLVWWGGRFPLGAIVPFGVVAALVASGMVVSTPWVGLVGVLATP